MAEGELVRLRQLTEAITTIGSDLDLEALLQRIIQSAVELVGARYGALGVLDEHRARLSQFHTTGIDDATRAKIGHVPEGHGILGLLIVDAKPLRLPDLGRHPDSHGFPPHHPPMTSFLGVPIRLQDRVFGNLYLTDKIDAPEFDALDEQLVVGLASVAAMAIEHARLYALVQDLTVAEDRERIARDLHDTVIQRLFATGLGLQATSRLVRADPARTETRLEQAVDELDVTVRQIRTTIFALGTANARSAGLRQRVLNVATDAARPLGFHPAVSFDGVIDSSVDDTTAGEVLAALREALTNVARHAHANRVEVAVSVHGQELKMVVTDDGVGAPPDAIGRGNGLTNLVARATRMHGTCTVGDGPAGGTVVTWAIPLAPGAGR